VVNLCLHLAGGDAVRAREPRPGRAAKRALFGVAYRLSRLSGTALPSLAINEIQRSLDRFRADCSAGNRRRALKSNRHRDRRERRNREPAVLLIDFVFGSSEFRLLSAEFRQIAGRRSV
jgi:hypothetical protein